MGSGPAVTISCQEIALPPTASVKLRSSARMADRNRLSAAILKAEMRGDKEAVAKLKGQLEQLNQPGSSKVPTQVETVKKVVSVQEEIDEDKLTLTQLVKRERGISVREDVLMSILPSAKKQKTQVVEPEKEYNCNKCIPSFPGISKGEKVVMHPAGHKDSVSVGHWIIRSLCHEENSFITADEDTVTEIDRLRFALCSLHQEFKQSLVFCELFNRKNKKHMEIDCLPIPEDALEEARMFFKKEILDHGSEWSLNKKLVEIKEKHVTRSLPKGLSYFWVTFDDTGKGFGHVIEDESRFPRNFGREIVQGLLDSRSKKKEKITEGNLRSKWKEFDPFDCE